MFPHIALCGRSGSGKTTIAKYIVSQYGFTLCSTGWIIRQISKLLFQTTSRTHLNLLTDALKAIEPNILISAALNNCKENGPIIFDSIRFKSDYYYLKSHGYFFIKVTAAKNIRLNRMNDRGQKHDAKVDENHVTEKDLDGVEFDFIIDNSSTISELFDSINVLLNRISNIYNRE